MKDWMIRWYEFYGKMGGPTRNPENLCRFVRVVCLWAPLRFMWAGGGPLGYPPPILCAIIIGGFVTLVGLMAYNVPGIIATSYHQHGAGMLIPDNEQIFWMLALTTVVMIAVTWCGLYDLWLSRLRAARAGKFCPFVDMPPVIPDAPAGNLAEQIDFNDYDDFCDVAAYLQSPDGGIEYHSCDLKKGHDGPHESSGVTDDVVAFEVDARIVEPPDELPTEDLINLQQVVTMVATAMDNKLMAAGVVFELVNEMSTKPLKTVLFTLETETNAVRLSSAEFYDTVAIPFAIEVVNRLIINEATEFKSPDMRPFGAELWAEAVVGQLSIGMYKTAQEFNYHLCVNYR